MSGRARGVAALVVLGLGVAGCAPPVAPAAELPAARLVGTDVASVCAPVRTDEGPDRRHVDGTGAPPAEELYRHVPPTGGRHLGTAHPLVVDATQPADVRATTHNLEHGAVVVHVDVARLGMETAAAVEAWAEQLGTAGFLAKEAAAGVLVVAMPAGATGAPAVAVRAWGEGLDCTGWDRPTADGFVARYYGDRGTAPEGGLAPYPEDNGVLLDAGPYA